MENSDFYTHPREMEPLFPSQNGELIDLAMNVHRKAAALGGSLHKTTGSVVAGLLGCSDIQPENMDLWVI